MNTYDGRGSVIGILLSCLSEVRIPLKTLKSIQRNLQIVEKPCFKRADEHFGDFFSLQSGVSNGRRY